MLLYILVLATFVLQGLEISAFTGMTGMTRREIASVSLSMVASVEVAPCSPLVSDTAQILCITSEESVSPYLTKPFDTQVKWHELLKHVSMRATWESKNGRFDATNGDLEIDVKTVEALQASKDPISPPILVLVGMRGPTEESFVREYLASRGDRIKAICSVDCSAEIEAMEKYGAYAGDGAASFLEDSIGSLFKTQAYMNKSSRELVKALFARQSVEDTLFAMLVLINDFTSYFIKSVQAATSSDRTGIEELKCMCTKCSKEMIDCVGNPECKKALDCLDKCKANDQVCSYKCITSYETKAFEAFALCILQRNNCMKNSASIPVVPNPLPMTTFRGSALTHETAEDLFIGHLSPRPGEANPLLPRGADTVPWSWKVVAGVNPAYDYFSDQHQIFYRDENRPKNVFWYDPVFKVITLEDEEVWRRRHYRVRRRKDSGPGTFSFTVLDNGVLSDEFWRILDVADDLSWAVFYYSGAASAAGTSYSGALVCTRDGYWPDLAGPEDPNYKRISRALASSGITMYELYGVTQSESHASPPPLGVK